MKTAVAQISCTLGDVDANLQTIRTYTTCAKEGGAELIVFPEMSDTGYSMPVIQKHASSWNEGAVPELQKLAADLSLTIICGVSERDRDCIYNSQVVINTAGEIVGRYRKTHLFSPAPIEEHLCFAAGDCLATTDVGALTLGLTICYDLRFPEVYRRLAVEEKSNALVISSAWPFPRVEHLRVLATARAIENQSYVILANRVGTDDGVTFCGTSAIIDPYGVVIAAASADREELLLADISDELVASIRSRMPIFDHRRAELYARPLL